MNKNIISKITSVAILSTLVSYSVPVFAFTKDETVYSKINSDGNTYSTIVSDHIKNEEQANIINDISDLLNIKNVSGDEEFSLNGNEISWSSNGNDIYYQGESKKELPIECNVKYELDGKEVTAEELAGKSGKIKITIEYINKDEHVVNVNGVYEKMYTPFVVVCGTVLDNDTHKNIEIKNGKLIDNGDKTVVIGMSMPGMQESLNISKSKLEIPSTVEITMDATDFELGNIVTYVTPKLLEEDDLEIFDKVDEIYSQVNTLQSASTQLVDGSSQLRDGMVELRSGINQFASTLNGKIDVYENTRAQINKKEVENKLVAMVSAEVKKLAPELEALAVEEASNVIKAHKEEIEEKTTNTALKYTSMAVQGKIEEIKNSDATIEIPEELLKQIENDVQTALSNVLQQEDVKQLETAIKTAIINDVKTTVKDTTKATIEQGVSLLKNVDPTQLLSETDKANLVALQESMKKGIMAQYPTVTEAQAEAQAKESINGLVKNVMSKTLDTVASKAPDMAAGAVDEIAKSLNTDEAIAKAISDFKDRIVTEITKNVSQETLAAMEKNIKKEIIEELETAFKNEKVLQQQIMQVYGAKIESELNLTIDSVAESTAQDLAKDLTEKLANEIATNLIKKQLNGELSETELSKELAKYETTINSKLEEVDGQISVLKNALGQLSNGAEQLTIGANTLSEGMIAFDEEGIQKICGLVNGDLNNITTRLEKLQELSKEYNNFTMLNDEDNGDVKFIMIMDSIKKSDESKQEVYNEEDKTKNN